MNFKVEDSCPTETVHSDFWWKVKALLEKPYDQTEYIGLWKAVKIKKFTERNMDLRNGGISYPTRVMGKSYLDHYEGEISILNYYYFIAVL